ncbi:MAG: Do family serine endopeptidase [Alphaproteobacteria bacterium]|nr:Do family serine endopeptidase [Alphaproteobacteria bacterium]
MIALVVSAVPANAQLIQKTVPDNKAQIQYSYAPVVKRTVPAVVNIYTKRKVLEKGYAPLLNDPALRELFGQQLFAPYVKQKIERSLGSGVIIRPNGLIITSNHVIKDSQEVTVVLQDRREFDAKVVLTDEKADLALLKIDTKNETLSALELINSDALEVGDIVLAIGNPFGVGQTVTNGIISALSRTNVGITDYQFFIQTDAPINPGNSGGALVTMDGKLAGVNTAIFSRSGGSHGIGFAIPANMVDYVIRSYEQGGQVRRPWLGAAFQPLTSDIANKLGLSSPAGALISNIYPASSAEKAGLQKGDIIMALDGLNIEDYQALNYRMATEKIGKTVLLDVVRGQEKIKSKMLLQEAKEEPAADKRSYQTGALFSGITIANLSPKLALEIEADPFKKGVVVYNAPNKARYVLKKGDIIKEINGIKIESVKQFNALISQPASSWKVVIERNGETASLLIR